MGKLCFRAVGVEESFECVFGTLSALMEGKIFGVSRFANGFQALGNFIQCLIPTDSFPFAFSTLPDSLERIEQSFRMVEMEETSAGDS